MLKSIHLENYKAFKECTIDFKPLTIFLGANSTGKSSIIQFLLMLTQTNLVKDRYNALLKLNGNLCTQGEIINLFHLKNESNVLKFSIEVKDEKKAFNFYEIDPINNFLRFLNGEIHNTTFFNEKKLTQQEKEEFLVHLNQLGVIIESSFITNQEQLDRFINVIKNFSKHEKYLKFFQLFRETLLSILIRNTLHSKRIFEISLNRPTKFIFHNQDIQDEDLVDLLNIFYDFSNLPKHNIIKIEYNLRLIAKKIVLINLSLLNENERVIEFEFDAKQKLKSIKSSYFGKVNVQKFKQYFTDIFFKESTLLNIMNSDKIHEVRNSQTVLYSAYIIATYLEYCFNILSVNFIPERIKYVNPLRAHPKRYYFLDLSNQNSFLNSLDGDSIAEILKNNKELQDKVNEWFSKLNIHFKVQHFKDIIHKLTVKLNNQFSLDVTDVGFGYSQILPVIIQGFLTNEGGVTIVEQPEIHLHPKIQADLADLFIDIIKTSHPNSTNRKHLIIETHSEYLLKRLRRRISEGKIDYKDVAIYFFEHDERTNVSEVKLLQIDETGDFEWPKNFYDGELFEDVAKFLINRSKRPK